MNGLERAIKHYGSQARLADALGVSKMAVCQWRKRGLPLDRALQLHELTNIPLADLHIKFKHVA